MGIAEKNAVTRPLATRPERQLLRTGVGGEVKIVALNGDNDIATGLYDAELEIEAPRLLHGFVSRNNRPVAIEDNARPAPNSRSEAA